jgi:hypothetical protein
MDSDDISLPSRLKEQYDFMQKNPEVVLSGAWAEKNDFAGEHIDLMLVPTDDKSLRTMLFFGNCFIHPLTIFDKAKALAVGGYPDNKHTAEDYGLWVKLAGVGQLANLNKILLKYRLSGENISVLKQFTQRKTTFKISYSEINAAIGKKLPKDAYRQFWYYWKYREGILNSQTVKDLMPLWDFATELPAPGDLAVSWSNIALSIIRSGNIFTGIILLNILGIKFSSSPGLIIKIKAILRGITNLAR